MARVSCWTQLQLLLHRNWLLVTRDRSGLAGQTLLPIIIFLLLSASKFSTVDQVKVIPEIRHKSPVTLHPFGSTLILDGGVLLYAPKGNNTANGIGLTYVELLMNELRELLMNELRDSIYGSEDRIIGFNNEQEIEAYQQQYLLQQTQATSSSGTKKLKHVWAAILFPPTDASSPFLPCDVSYTLRLNGSTLPSTALNAEFQTDRQANSENEASVARIASPEVGEIMADTQGSIQTAQYLASGFLDLQASLNQAIFNVRTREQLNLSTDATAFRTIQSPWPLLHTIGYQSFPTHSYTIDPFHEAMSTVGPIYLILGFLPLLQRATMQLVLEKEKRIKEQMKMAGLRDSVFIVGLYLTYFFIALIPITIISLLSTAYQLYPHTSFMVIFTLFLLYIQCLLLFSFIISTFFSKSKLAGQFASTGIFLIFLPQYLIPSQGRFWLFVSNFSPPIVFTRGFQALTDAESEGITLDLFHLSGSPSSTTSLQTCFNFLLIDILILSFFAWYFEQVIQNTYGQAKPWNFLCQGWRQRRYQPLRDQNGPDDEPNEIELQPSLGGTQSNRYSHVPVVVSAPSTPAAPIIEEQVFHLRTSPGTHRSSQEQLQSSVKPGIRLINIHKDFDTRSWFSRISSNLRARFTSSSASHANDDPSDSSSKSGVVHALRGLSLSITRGEILSFLGVNASGKTTSLSILSGLFAPNSGQVIFDGMGEIDLATGQRGPLELSPLTIETIREHLFVCPQSDIFFDGLTVREHLNFYARLKGVASDRLDEHINHKLQQLTLDDKSNEYVKNLSGGQKRKLCVALAFMGIENDSDERCQDIIFLDEPTSGVDPVSRKNVWDMIRSYKKNRVIVLTTHSMSEAELLGDRIAIIHSGQLRCAGSSLFLKKQFGVGYKCEILVDHTTSESTIQELTAFIQTTIEGAERVLTEEQIIAHGQSGLDEDELDHASSSIHSNSLASPSTPSSSSIANTDPIELIYMLPLDALPLFSILFHELEKESTMRRFRIQPNGITVSLNSLEEIFFRVIEDTPATPSHEESATSISIGNSDPYDEEAINSLSSRPPPSFSRVMKALLSKKASLASNDKKSLLFFVLFPVLYVAFGLLVSLKGLDTSLLRDSTQIDFSSGAPRGVQTSFDRLFPSTHAVLPVQIFTNTSVTQVDWIRTTLFPSTSTPTSFFLPQSNQSLADGTHHPDLDNLESYLLHPTHTSSVNLDSSDDGYVNAAVYYSGSDIPIPLIDILYNNTATHVAPIMLNSISSSILAGMNKQQVRFINLTSSEVAQAPAVISDSCIVRSISGSNKPFPSSLNSGIAALSLHIANFVVGLLLTISLSYLPIQFGVNILKYEKNDSGSSGGSGSTSAASNDPNNSAKASNNFAMQKFHGGSAFMKRFWFINWMGDITLVMIPITLIFILFTVFGNTLLLGANTFGALTILLCWAGAIIVQTYGWTYIFSTGERMQLILSTLYSTLTLFLFIFVAFYKLYVGAQTLINDLDPTGNNGSGGHSKTDTDPTNPLSNIDWDFTLLMSFLSTTPSIIGLISVWPAFALPWSILQLGLQNYVNTKREAICRMEGEGGTVDSTGVTHCVRTSQFEVLQFARLGGVVLGLLLSISLSWLFLLYKERYLVRWYRQYLAPSSSAPVGVMFSLAPQNGAAINGHEHGGLLNQANGSVASQGEPIDVAQERIRVHRSFNANGIALSDPAPDPLTILDLCKTFPLAEPLVLPPPELSAAALAQLRQAGIDPSYAGVPRIIREKRAIDRVSLGVREGETFGLLGPNGAGKSSTMNVLIGSLVPDSGFAFYDGVSAIDPNANAQFDRVSHLLAFVPQSFGLYDTLTPTDHMFLYGRLKGLSDSLIRRRMGRFFRELQLDEHAHSHTENLSGGTKRKVSLCIALISNPRILLLDEPSSGVDVASRRAMWKLLRAGDSNEYGSDSSSSLSSRSARPHPSRSTILTTHSLEEAETLSTRLGILINGSFRCMGTARELKSRHGGGMELQIKLVSQLSSPDEESEFVDTSSDQYMAILTAFLRTLIARVRAAPVNADAIEEVKDDSNEVGTSHGSEFHPDRLPPLDGFPFTRLPTSIDPIDDSSSSNSPASVVELISSYNGLLTFNLPTPTTTTLAHTNQTSNLSSSHPSSPSSNSSSPPFSLSLFFAYMHLYSPTYGIRDFTLNASTLDQVFLKFAREQIGGDDA